MSEHCDTPETEHALHGVWYRGDHGSAIPALCRKLERERNAARAEVARLSKIIERAVDDGYQFLEEK